MTLGSILWFEELSEFKAEIIPEKLKNILNATTTKKSHYTFAPPETKTKWSEMWGIKMP